MFDMPQPKAAINWNAVLDHIANGGVPADFCATQQMPERPVEIERRAKEDAAFSVRLDEARLIGAVVMLAECRHIADRDDLRADQKKIMIDIRKSLAAIWNPEKCTERKVIEQTTIHKTFTPREEYIEQMVSLLGFTKAEAAARYEFETATVQ